MSRLRPRSTALPGLTRLLLRRLTAESPALLALSTATAIAQSALLIPIAVLVRHMFDTEIPRRQAGSIVVTGVAILALYGAAAAFGYLARSAALRQAAPVVTRLRLDLLGALHRLPQRWHDDQRMAAVHTSVAQDTERVEAMLASFAGNILPAIMVGVALLVTAVILSPLLSATSLAVIPPLTVAARLLARRVRSRTKAWSESSRWFSAYTQMLLRALVTTRIVGGEEWALARASDGAADLAERHRRLGTAAALWGAVENAIAAAAGTAVIIVGGIAVAHRTITLGDLLAFYAVLGLLLRSVHSLGLGTNNVVIGLQSLRDIELLLAIDEAEPYSQRGRTLRFRGGITLDRVSFSYTDAPVLTEVRIAIDPGEHVAMIGPNGAGKSTLVNLVLGLYEPDAGRIEADGVPYAELDIRALRRQFGVVLQDPVLLPGTIRENIAYARPDASEESVRRAAEAATAAEFIEALPEGYETPIGDEGTGLSGGQRQRIAIARAILGAPALVLLDEPSTYLDDASVMTLMSGLMALPQAPTVLLVTHDPQVARHVDRVIELRAGRVVGDSQTSRRVGAAGA